jgi:hypothetical protein
MLPMLPASPDGQLLRCFCDPFNGLQTSVHADQQVTG